MAWVRWLRRSTLAFAVLAYLVVAVGLPRAERAVFGVRPGVTLAGRPLGGRLPREVSQYVRRLAATLDRPAVPAVLNKRTGAVVPGRPGWEVNVAATVAAVERAAPGAAVQPVRRRSQPSVTSAELRGRPVLLAQVPAPPPAAALDNTLILPRHPFVFALGGGCDAAAALARAARRAGLRSSGPGAGCRVVVRNDGAQPVVLGFRGGRLSIWRYAAPRSAAAPGAA